MLTNRILITGDFEVPPHYLDDNVYHLRKPRSQAHIAQHLEGIEHYIVGGPEYLDEFLLDQAPDLKQVIVMGTGTNSFIDLAAARERQIIVNNTPGINADAVAEFAVGAIIMNLANSFYSYGELLKGDWLQKPHKTLKEVSIGIIGLGQIGTRLVKKIRGLTPKSPILYYSRSRKPQFEAKYQVKFRTLEELMQESDVVALCITYTRQTHEMLNACILEKAKSGIMIFNFSNPLVIEPTALRSFLLEGKVQRAFFDGYYNEWVTNEGLSNDDHKLLSLGPDKFVATSHIAAQSQIVVSSIIRKAFSLIKLWKESNV